MLAVTLEFGRKVIFRIRLDFYDSVVKSQCSKYTFAIDRDTEPLSLICVTAAGTDRRHVYIPIRSSVITREMFESNRPVT